MTKWAFRKCGIVIALALWIKILAGGPGVEEKNKSDKLHENNIVYDVSTLLHTDQVLDGKVTLSDFYSAGNANSTFYYEINGNLSKEVLSEFDLWASGISFLLFGSASLDGVRSLSNKTELTETLATFCSTEKFPIKSVIFSVSLESCSCFDYFSITKYAQRLQKRRNFAENQYGDKTRFALSGFEYNHKLIECCDIHNPIFQIVDHTVLSVHVSPLTTMLSYGEFFELMTRLVRENGQFIRKRNSKCTSYVRLVVGDWKESISTGSYSRYGNLIFHFLHAWRKDNLGSKTRYIIPPYSDAAALSDNNQFMKENVSSVQYFGNEVYITEPDSDEDLLQLSCEAQEKVKQLLQAFSCILLKNPNPTFLNRLLATCQHDNLDFSNVSSSEIDNLRIVIDNAPPWTEEEVNALFNFLRSHPVKALGFNSVYIDAVLTNDPKRWPYFKRLLDLVSSQDVPVNCYVYSTGYHDPLADGLSSFVQNVVQDCGHTFNTSQEILYGFWLIIYKKEELLVELKNIQEAKVMFEGAHPDKKFVPSIVLVLVHKINSYMSHTSVYCNPEAKLFNEYYQTVISFANIHQWTKLNIENIFHDAQTDASINRSLTRFPLYWRTNAEKSMNGHLPIMTYSCIEWTHTADPNGMNFLENNLLGASFSVKLRLDSRLSSDELQMAVRFALGRFSSVELIARDTEDLSLATGVLSPALLHDVTAARVQVPQVPLVYIEIPLANLSSLRQQVSNELAQKLTSVHLSEWESHLGETWDQMVGKRSDFPASFGVTVQNCSHEINLGLARLKYLPFIKMVTYIVCNVKPIQPINFNHYEMDPYFQTIFYLKSYFERHLPAQVGTTNAIEVIFRINVIPPQGLCSVGNANGEREYNSFFKFLNHMDQHSAAYNIRYFVVRAFEAEDFAGQCSYTWWQLKSYTNLANVSIYVDAEDEYFERPTKTRIPFLFKAETTLSTTSVKIGWIFASIVMGFAVSGVLIFGLWLSCVNKRLLTQAEVDQFRNGIELHGDNDQMEMTPFVDSAYMKFSQEFEVPFRDISIGNLIGQGQFGFVHKGLVVSQQLEVAIKLPKPACDKKQFLSTLSELKILAYIGNHPNIVIFLGACTKRIPTGKLYILIEYCEHGSLLSFLKKLQSQKNEGPFNVDLYQLYTFSFQIASGMEYVAEKRVVHGDLAARNVLLTSDYVCKVADFGMSRRLYELNELQDSASTEMPLPWRWTALESLTSREFSTKFDLWSYGVTLYEIFSLGKMPYPNSSFTADFVRELENGMRMERAEHAIDDVYNKTLDCWNRSPDERPIFADLKTIFADLRKT